MREPGPGIHTPADRSRESLLRFGGALRHWILPGFISSQASAEMAERAPEAANIGLATMEVSARSNNAGVIQW